MHGARIQRTSGTVVVAINGIVHRLPWSQTVDFCQSLLAFERFEVGLTCDEIVLNGTQDIGLCATDILLQGIGVIAMPSDRKSVV